MLLLFFYGIAKETAADAGEQFSSFIGVYIYLVSNVYIYISRKIHHDYSHTDIGVTLPNCAGAR